MHALGVEMSSNSIRIIKFVSRIDGKMRGQEGEGRCNSVRLRISAHHRSHRGSERKKQKAEVWYLFECFVVYTASTRTVVKLMEAIIT